MQFKANNQCQIIKLKKKSIYKTKHKRKYKIETSDLNHENKITSQKRNTKKTKQISYHKKLKNNIDNHQNNMDKI